MLSSALRVFLMFVTGSVVPRLITVAGTRDSHGSIVAHTCANSISSPLDVFKDTEVSYSEF